MNLILFEASELTQPLPADDPRARHVRTVLRRREGESFDCGVIDGPRGKARVIRLTATHLELAFEWRETPPPLPPLTVVIGLPRPQTVRKILVEVTSLGVAQLIFAGADRSEPAYAQSTVWHRGEVRRQLAAGAAQACCTRLPQVVLVDALDAALARVPEAPTRLALDNYEAVAPLARAPLQGAPAVLAIGPERGWSGRERDGLRAAGFTLVHLGPRVLRSETACVAGLTLLQARLGLP